MTEEQRLLVEENHKLIFKVIIDMNLEIDDLYDIAAIGLCKAAKVYNYRVSDKYPTDEEFIKICQNVRKHYYITKPGITLVGANKNIIQIKVSRVLSSLN